MFHSIMNIINLIMMVVLGALFLWITKKKKNNNETKTKFEELVKTVDYQQTCIEVMLNVSNSTADLLQLISKLVSNGIITAPGDSNDVSQVFKEVSYKIYSHAAGSNSNHDYSFLKHECFNDPNNCIKLLSDVLKNVDNLPIHSVVQNFIIHR